MYTLLISIDKNALIILKSRGNQNKWNNSALSVILILTQMAKKQKQKTTCAKLHTTQWSSLNCVPERDPPLIPGALSPCSSLLSILSCKFWNPWLLSLISSTQRVSGSLLPTGSPGASLKAVSLCKVRAHFMHFPSLCDHITAFPTLWYLRIIVWYILSSFSCFDRRVNLVYVAPSSPEANAVSQIFKLLFPAWLFISFWYWLMT